MGKPDTNVGELCKEIGTGYAMIRRLIPPSPDHSQGLRSDLTEIFE